MARRARRARASRSSPASRASPCSPSSSSPATTSSSSSASPCRRSRSWAASSSLTNALRSLIADDRRAYNVGGEKRIEDSDVEKADIDPSSIAIVPHRRADALRPRRDHLGDGARQPLSRHRAAAGGDRGHRRRRRRLLARAARPPLPLSRIIGDRGRAVFTKIMSLLLGAIGIQFIINGLKPVILEIMKTTP